MRWPLTRLGDCCEVISGATPKTGIDDYWGGEILWATPKDISKLKSPFLVDTPDKITMEGYRSCSTKLIPVGAVLVSSRAPIGLVAIAGAEMCTNQGFKSLVPGQTLHSGYLYHCMKANSARLAALGNGATFKEVSKSIVENFEIPLPPLQEQQRIAAILDKAGSLRRNRQEAIRLADEFLRSAFFHSFGDADTNQRDWPWVRLEDVALQVTDGEHQTPQRSSEGIYLLSARNVQNGFLALDDVDYVPPDEFERIRRRCEPKRGDILISCSGSIGRVSQVAIDEPLALVRSVALVRPDTDKVRSSFLEHFLRSPPMQRRMVAASKSSAQANLFQGPIRALPVMLPPIEDQVRFERVVSRVTLLREKSAAASAELNSLAKSLQSRFFQ